jgi:hypothetical protein
MVATLDHRRRNRGMTVCHEMTRWCGAHAEVREHVDRIIDERTGTMREIYDTVSLRNMRSNSILTPRDSECLCAEELGDCPRGERMYWREIWLERASAREPSPAEAASSTLASGVGLPNAASKRQDAHDGQRPPDDGDPREMAAGEIGAAHGDTRQG